jgi:hypothetical protein
MAHNAKKPDYFQLKGANGQVFSERGLPDLDGCGINAHA